MKTTMSAKVIPIRPPTPEAKIRALKVDRFGELNRLRQIQEPWEEERKALGDEIQSWHKQDDPAVPSLEVGSLYLVQLSARRNERTIVDKRKVWNVLKTALGIDGLIALVTIPMAAIDASIPKTAQAKLVTEERAGYRTLTVVPLKPATKLAA